MNRLPFSTANEAYLAPDLFADMPALVTDLELPLMAGTTPESEVLRRLEPLRRAVRLALGEHVSYRVGWLLSTIGEVFCVVFGMDIRREQNCRSEN